MEKHKNVQREGVHCGSVQRKVDEKARKRYDEKVKGVNGLDPYEHKQWTKDVSVLPNFQHAHIYNYMILSISAYTHEIFSNFRSLQQPQVQFTDGGVQDLEMFRVDSKTIVRTKVRSLFPNLEKYFFYKK